ncbi:MAG: transglutaminase domain-containing protein [Actinobacteria bacterium]|nr:transglutaminase domain-containing protein [Actinomycetota bacterium]
MARLLGGPAVNQQARSGGSSLLLAEAALLLVHLAVVAGFVRLYEDWSFAPDLVVAVVVAHVLAALSRRWLPAPAAALVAVGGLALTVAWLLFPDTTTAGLPGTATWDALVAALRDGRDTFREVTAPTVPIVGFQAATVLALWVTVWFADWSAFRLRATVEAVAPATVLFVFTTMLGSGSYRVASAIAFGAAVLLFVVAHRALRARVDLAWLSDDPSRAPHLLLRAGVATAAVALLAGVVAAPLLPGAGEAPVVDWRDDGSTTSSDRTTVSPIVDLRRRLVNQSDEVFFRVRAARSAYWRLTALDRFDGDLWTIDQQFTPVDGNLADPEPADDLLQQTVNIVGMDDLWVPAAYEPQRVLFSSANLRWDPDTSTLVIDEGDQGTAGMEYRVVSALPSFTEAQVRAAEGPDPASLQALTSLPDSFPELARDLALEVTDGATTRYDKAIALQNWFRTEFSYSTDVPAGHSDRALVDFLQDRQGYCEQFAGSFAAMARSLGIPSRVAIGFTQGELDPDTDQYVVRGRHAHAWPEVYMPGLGWVAFEPTPGRGMPGAEAYTGVAPEQDRTRTTPAPTTTTSTTAAATTPTAASGSTTTTEPPVATVASPSSGSTSDRSPAWVVAGVLAAITVVAALAVAVVRSGRGRRHGHGPDAEILASWDRAVAAVRRSTGLRPTPAETHAEFARRGGASASEVADPLVQLGDLVGLAAWNPASLTDADVRRAEALRDDVRTTLDDDQRWYDRFRRPSG